jgi:hypothetical protein
MLLLWGLLPFGTAAGMLGVIRYPGLCKLVNYGFLTGIGSMTLGFISPFLFAVPFLIFSISGLAQGLMGLLGIISFLAVGSVMV